MLRPQLANVALADHHLSIGQSRGGEGGRGAARTPGLREVDALGQEHFAEHGAVEELGLALLALGEVPGGQADLPS